MTRKQRRERDWLKREASIRFWLGPRLRRFDEPQPKLGRRELANKTCWAWLPVAAVLFWATGILTAWISFTDDSEPPTYYVSAGGATTGPVRAVIRSKEGSDGVDLLMQKGVELLIVDHVSGKDSCSAGTIALDPNDPLYSHQVEYTSYLDSSGRLSWAFKLDSSQTPDAYFSEIFCKTDWIPERSSFASSRLSVGNDYPHPVMAITFQNSIPALTPLVVEVSSSYLDDARISGPAGERGADWSERRLGPGDSVIVDWKPSSKGQLRDVVLVVIGSLIALGAATVLEAIRPLVNLAVGGEPEAAEND